jgi:hypothetical protein
VNPNGLRSLPTTSTKLFFGDQSPMPLKSLVADVAEAKKINDEFSLNHEIEDS